MASAIKQLTKNTNAAEAAVRDALKKIGKLLNDSQKAKSPGAITQLRDRLTRTVGTAEAELKKLGLNATAYLGEMDERIVAEARVKLQKAEAKAAKKATPKAIVKAEAKVAAAASKVTKATEKLAKVQAKVAPALAAKAAWPFPSKPGDAAPVAAAPAPAPAPVASTPAKITGGKAAKVKAPTASKAKRS